METKTMTNSKKIAYFPTFYDARDFGGACVKGYPAWLVVLDKKGWAVQCRPGGDYFAKDGTLSESTKGAK